MNRRLSKVTLVLFCCRSCSCKVWQFGYHHPIPALWRNSFEHHYHPMSGVQRNIAQTEGLRTIPVGSIRSMTCSDFKFPVAACQESQACLWATVWTFIFLSNRALTILTNFAHVQYCIWLRCKCTPSVTTHAYKIGIEICQLIQQAWIWCHSVGTVCCGHILVK